MGENEMSPAICFPSIDSTTSLEDLVFEAQAGDRAALGEIFRRYQRSVFGIALRRLGSEAEAQEVVQEVFMQLLRKIGQLREPACLGGWLRSITHRLAINRISRRAMEVATDSELLEASRADVPTPLASAMARERAAEVHAGLDRLGRLDRETLVAFYVQGQSLVEMSAAFDSPVGTIKRRLHTARKRLARELGALA